MTVPVKDMKRMCAFARDERSGIIDLQAITNLTGVD